MDCSPESRVPWGDRIRAARIMLELYKEQDDGAAKPAWEMSAEELSAEIAKRETQMHALETLAAAKAIDVTPGAEPSVFD
jgi:hypothetical protein